MSLRVARASARDPAWIMTPPVSTCIAHIVPLNGRNQTIEKAAALGLLVFCYRV